MTKDMRCYTSKLADGWDDQVFALELLRMTNTVLAEGYAIEDVRVMARPVVSTPNGFRLWEKDSIIPEPTLNLIEVWVD